MEYPRVSTTNDTNEKHNPLYTIEFGNYTRYLTEKELIQLFEEIDDVLPPNTIERTISERVAALERTIGECPCHNH